MPATVDLAPYDLVVVGGPIWYWHPSAVAMSFLRQADLAGKAVVLFYTYEGGGMSDDTELEWRATVERRGGVVRDVVGVNRKELVPEADLGAEGERIAAAARSQWQPSAAEARPTIGPDPGR